MVRSLFRVANKYNPVMIEEDQLRLKAQHEEKLRRQELVKEKSLEKAENACVKSVLWYERFDGLAWKSVREASNRMRSLKTKSIQLKELKFQLSIWKYGVGFSEFNIHFSKNSSALTATELVQMLKDVIKRMAGKPISPPVLEMPSIKTLPVIGNATSDVAVFEKSKEDLKKDIELKALQQQNNQALTGELDVFSIQQPPTPPDLRVGMRVDCLFNYGDDEEASDVLMWSQGRITLLSNGNNIPKDSGGFHKKGDVQVLWDGNESRNELCTSSVITLKKNMFNKQVENSWRLDVNL